MLYSTKTIHPSESTTGIERWQSIQTIVKLAIYFERKSYFQPPSLQAIHQSFHSANCSNSKQFTFKYYITITITRILQIRRALLLNMWIFHIKQGCLSISSPIICNGVGVLQLDSCKYLFYVCVWTCKLAFITCLWLTINIFCFYKSFTCMCVNGCVGRSLSFIKVFQLNKSCYSCSCSCNCSSVIIIISIITCRTNLSVNATLIQIQKHSNYNNYNNYNQLPWKRTSMIG